MTESVIEEYGPEELPQLLDLFNQIFRPAKTHDALRRRYLGRHNVLQLIARVKDRPIGFFLGFELKPDTYFAWFYGVLPEFRRMGIGSQLMDAAQRWAAKHSYPIIRIECHNQHRPMLHLAIDLGYDIVGLRWDSDRSENLVMLEKRLDK